MIRRTPDSRVLGLPQQSAAAGRFHVTRLQIIAARSRASRSITRAFVMPHHMSDGRQRREFSDLTAKQKPIKRKFFLRDGTHFVCELNDPRRVNRSLRAGAREHVLHDQPLFTGLPACSRACTRLPLYSQRQSVQAVTGQTTDSST